MRIRNPSQNDANALKPASAAPAVTAAPPAPAPAAPARPAEKTLIMNEGMPIVDRDSLRLVIQSIMRTNRDEAEIESLTLDVLALNVPLDTHDAVAGALRIVVGEKMKTAEFFEKGLEVLIKLSEHELNTTRNRTAFAPSLKQNPNTVFWPDRPIPSIPAPCTAKRPSPSASSSSTAPCPSDPRAAVSPPASPRCSRSRSSTTW
jgi:hypothetical protein